MGAVKQKRAMPFALFYLKYYACLFVGILLIAGLIVVVFELLIVNGLVYPADYAQMQAGNAVDEIAGAEAVDESMIPQLCQYVLFDAKGEIIGGNVESSGVQDAWRAVEEETTHIGGNYYTVIGRGGEYCVLRYVILPQYRSALLRRYLPGPQNLLLTSGLCAILLLIVLTAVRFGHTMKKKLSPLIAATNKIQNQELEFCVQESDIREISAVLQALDDMRAALKDSLESQWKLEQTKREQTLALAHDLKTPLTLARGNADLLYDTALSEEQKECVGYIESSVMQMQNYVQTLIEITRDGYRLRLEQNEIAPFLAQALELARGLCAVRNIRLETNFTFREQSVLIDRELLLRAFCNVFSNAAEYAGEGGSVSFEVREEADRLVCSITDTGSGFSAEALRRGAEQFYMGDESRTSNGHFGIGLYMTGLVMKQHGGQLLLENCEETGGARVTLLVPYMVK